MRALLDTHTFLWWNMDDPRLSSNVRTFIKDGQNEVYLSAASAWELSIKFARGRIELPEKPDQYVAKRLAHYQFLTMPIELSHALFVAELPAIHQDPFDRLLIAQSLLEDLPILTSDPEIKKYAVEIIW